jgi:hypothetical protein
MFAMTVNGIPCRRLQWTSSLLLIAVGCTEPPATTQIAVAPPVPASQARVWFYRPYEPSESFNLAQITMNGSYIGAVENGSALWRTLVSRGSAV